LTEQSSIYSQKEGRVEKLKFANWTAEFGKICHRKLWALGISKT